jgi:hypothetical protein
MGCLEGGGEEALRKALQLKMDLYDLCEELPQHWQAIPWRRLAPSGASALARSVVARRRPVVEEIQVRTSSLLRLSSREDEDEADTRPKAAAVREAH